MLHKKKYENNCNIYLFTMSTNLNKTFNTKGKIMIEYTPIFIVGIVFFASAYVIKIISENRIRSRLIDSGKIDKQTQYLFSKPQFSESSPMSSLKWGFVLIALGAALFIGRLFPYEMEGEGTMGLMFLFSGIAFLIYYFISQNKNNDDSANMDNSIE